MKYYTLQVKLVEGYIIQGLSVLEYKDIEYTVENVKRSMEIWTRGCKWETAPGTFQLISPFSIHEAFIIKQDKKYSI